MPRQARIGIPSLLQHVIVRGIERTDIFLNDEDREDFVERLPPSLLKQKLSVTLGLCLTLISTYCGNLLISPWRLLPGKTFPVSRQFQFGAFERGDIAEAVEQIDGWGQVLQ